MHFTDDVLRSYSTMNIKKQIGGGGVNMRVYNIEDETIEGSF